MRTETVEKVVEELAPSDKTNHTCDKGLQRQNPWDVRLLERREGDFEGSGLEFPPPPAWSVRSAPRGLGPSDRPVFQTSAGNPRPTL